MSIKRFNAPPGTSSDCRVNWQHPSPASSTAAHWMRESFGCALEAPPGTLDNGAELELQLALNAEEARQLSEAAYAHMVKSYPGESFLQELALCQDADEIRAVLERHPELPAHWLTADLMTLQEKARQVIAVRFTGSALLKALALAETPLDIEETFARCSSVETVAEALLLLRRQSGGPLPGTLTLQAARSQH